MISHSKPSANNNIDAITGGANNQFTFISSSVFSNIAGQLRFSDGLLSGDVNGDGVADFEIAVVGQTALLAADFIL